MAALEADTPRCRAHLQQLVDELGQQEAALEAMHEAIKGEVEGYHKQLSEVCGLKLVEGWQGWGRW